MPYQKPTLEYERLNRRGNPRPVPIIVIAVLAALGFGLLAMVIVGFVGMGDVAKYNHDGIKGYVPDATFIATYAAIGWFLLWLAWRTYKQRKCD